MFLLKTAFKSLYHEHLIVGRKVTFDADENNLVNKREGRSFTP